MTSMRKVIMGFRDHIFGRAKSINNSEPNVSHDILTVESPLPFSIPVQSWDEKTRSSVLIDELPLPTQVLNSLMRNNIYTVGDLESCTEEKLIEMKMIGAKSLKKIKDTYRLLFNKTLDFNQDSNFMVNSMQPKPKINTDIPSQMDEIKQKVFTPIIEKVREYALITPENVFNLKFFNENTYLKSTLADEIYLDHLDLPQKLLNPLNKIGIYTVGDLRMVPVCELFKIKSVGKIMLINLSKSLNDKNQKGIIKDGQTFIDALLCRIPEGRDKEILIRRYGFRTGERQTLEEIGNDYKVTRERIRQIEKKSLTKIKKIGYELKKRYIDKIEDLLRVNGGIVTDEEADKLLPKAINIDSYDGSSILDLLVDLQWLIATRIGDVSFYYPIFNELDINFIHDLIPNIKNLRLADFTIDEIQHLLKTDLLSCGSGSIKIEQFLEKLLNIHPLIQKAKNGKFKLFYSRLGSGIWISMIKRLLEETGIPLHFTEITEKINDKIKNNLELHLDVHRTHSLLIESAIFAHTGVRGTYGLVEWGIRKESTFDLIVECINKAGFPLHWEQIYHYVSKYKNTKEMNIKSLLSFNKKFKHLGNGVYGLN